MRTAVEFFMDDFCGDTGSGADGGNGGDAPRELLADREGLRGTCGAQWGCMRNDSSSACAAVRVTAVHVSDAAEPAEPLAAVAAIDTATADSGGSGSASQRHQSADAMLSADAKMKLRVRGVDVTVRAHAHAPRPASAASAHFIARAWVMMCGQ